MLKKMIKGLCELLVGAAVIAGAVYYYKTTLSSVAGAKKKAATTPYVTIEKQHNIKFADIIPAVGTGASKESVDITAIVTAKVIEINFKDGDFVKAGTLLVKLDDAKEQAEKRQAEINIEEQEREMLRIEKLFKGRAVSQKSYDEQKTSLARTKTLLAVVNSQISDRHIKAPFTGRLGIRLVSLGDMVSPGTKITSIDDLSVINVDFSLPEKYFAKLKTGSEVSVTNVAYPGEKFIGKISAISPRINHQTRSIEVRAVIDNKDNKLRPGMMFNVEVDMGIADALMIPEKAVTTLGEIQSVFKYLPDGTVKKMEVTLGRRRDGRVEVISGLNSGDTIVVEGVAKLVDGMKVDLSEISRNKKAAETGSKQE